MMHGPEESDSVVVAGKPTNKAERSAAEPVEPRAGTEVASFQWTVCQLAVYVLVMAACMSAS